MESIPISNDIEVIIVDDKSENEHIHKIESLKKRNDLIDFSFYSNNTPIQSAGTCRNIGLNCALGKWIYFADSDDFFLEDFYLKTSDYFNSDNDVVFFYPTSQYIDGKKGHRHLIYEQIFNNYITKANEKDLLKLRYKTYAVWIKLINKDFIKKHGIKFDEVPAANDVMFSTKVGFHMNKFTISENTTYCIVRRKGSLTVQIKKEFLESRINVLISQYSFLSKKLSQEQMKELNINCFHTIIKSSRYSFLFALKLFLIFRKENIPFLNLSILKEHLNFNYLRKKFFAFYKDKHYEEREER